MPVRIVQVTIEVVIQSISAMEARPQTQFPGGEIVMQPHKVTSKTKFSPAREAEILAAEARSVARLQGRPAPIWAETKSKMDPIYDKLGRQGRGGRIVFESTN